MTAFATIVSSTYDLRLVAVSALVAVIASYAALDLAGRVTATRGYAHALWLSGGAVTMGLGIWSMHFIGMLAFHLAMPLRYNISLVSVSFLIAVAASGFALFMASRPTLTLQPLLGGGLCLGLGIAAMHYTGMAAMEIDGSIQYRPLIVGASLLIAISASVVALWLAFHLRSIQGSTRGWIARKLGSAGVMGAAIVGMHYTGMTAATVTTAHTGHALAALDTNTFTLAIALSGTTLLILGVALLSALVDRRFSTQIATFESLFLHSTDAIFALDVNGTLRRANPAAARLTGYALDRMPARPLDALLDPANQARLTAQLQQAAQGDSQQGDYPLVNQAGHQLIGHATMVPIIVDAQISGVYTIIRDITARRQDEDALKGQRDRYEQVLRGLSDLGEGMLVVDDQRIVFANDALCRISGYRQDELQAFDSTLALVAPESRDATAQRIAQIDAGDESSGRFESVIQHKDGHRIPVESASQVVHADGRQQRMTLLRDITERKQAEVALRAAEVRFRTLVEQLPAITYIAALDEDSSTIYTSPQIESMLGFTQAEWMTDHQLWRKQIHPDDIAAVMAVIECAHATSSPVPTEYRMLTRTGESKWFRDQSVIVRDDAGQPHFLQGIMFDITEPKQAEEALRRSETRNRALINAIPDVMFRLDKAGVYLDYKADTRNDLLRLPADLCGKTLADVLPPDVTVAIMAGIDRAFMTGLAQLVEYQLVRHTGIQEFEARIVICGADEVLAIIRNITERKQMERLKNEFVATVSHELRTPLTSIRGSLGLIAGGVAGAIPPNVQRMVDIACKNSDRLIRLINDILDIEKIESGKRAFILQPCALLPLVDQAITANRAYGAQFNVTFALACTARNVWVSVDSDRLIQALTNLLANAAKFSPPGATVQVQVSQAANRIRVAIIDHGPGIPEAFRDQLFQKFAQADASNTREKGGTGLGLSITKAIVEKLGGAVDYAPNQPSGATFVIDLPQWHASTPDASDAHMLPRVLQREADRDGPQGIAVRVDASTDTGAHE